MRIILIMLVCFLSQQYSIAQKCTNGDCVNGKGRFLFPNGDKYIGEFKSSQPDGRGAYTYANGDVYKGQFKKGRRHGYGTMTWKVGEMYIGEYVKDLREGEGTYYYKDGRIVHGKFKGGKLIEDLTVKKDTAAVVVNVDTASNNRPDPLQNNQSQANQQHLFPTGGIIPNEKRFALIIGNSNYSKLPLKNPKNDATAIAAELRKMGFEVWLLLDASKRDMKQAIRDFGQQLKDNKAVGLFFYAGHGIQADAKNYILPIDADIRKAQDIEFEALDLGRVFVELEYAENPMNIVILDACRDNPYKSQFGEKAKNYTGFTLVQNAPVNSLIAFSTAPNAVASDGTGNNGLYTEELVKVLPEKGLKLEDIFKKVRSSVRKASNGKQIPWENSSIESDFYFHK